MADDERAPANQAPVDKSGQLEKTATRSYVLGSLVMRGAAHADLAARARRSIQWYTAVVTQIPRGGSLVPYFIVHDLGWLLVDGDSFPFRARAERHDARQARVTYENRFLNQLLRDDSFQRAHVAIQSNKGRDELIARAIALVLAPITTATPKPGSFRLNNQYLRDLQHSIKGQLSPEREAEAWDEETGVEESHALELESLLEILVMRAGRTAFLEEDLREIEAWDAYKRAEQRVMGRRVVAFASRIPAFDLRKVRIAEETGPETELPDAGTWAEGGYTGITTKGVIESLVPTEVAYLGEDVGLGQVDLFQLRDIDQQLLYWERDQGELQRIRRVVHVALMPSRYRFKSPGQSESEHIVLYGVYLRLVSDLAKIFKDDAIMVVLHLVARDGAETEVARQEEALLRVLLRSEIRTGYAEVVIEPYGFDVRDMADTRTLETKALALEKAAKEAKDDKEATWSAFIASKMATLSKGIVYCVSYQHEDEPVDAVPATKHPAALRRDPRVIVVKVGGSEPEKVGRSRRGEPAVVFLGADLSSEDLALLARDEIVAQITG